MGFLGSLMILLSFLLWFGRIDTYMSRSEQVFVYLFCILISAIFALINTVKEQSIATRKLIREQYKAEKKNAAS